MRCDSRTIDAGVRDAVALLNRIPGVTTRASCQGTDPQPAAHRHADLAYVLLQYPMPLCLQDFLVARLAALARVEDNAVYSRWPVHNRAFLAALASAARSYLSRRTEARTDMIRWPLTKLRAPLARQISRGSALQVRLCLGCRRVVGEPHLDEHPAITLLRLPPDQQDRWFAEFVVRPGNALDPGLIASDGWVRLIARTHRGDFGTTFRRRWLRHRARRIAQLTTAEIRHAIADARRQGWAVDFFYDRTHAVFAWDQDHRARRTREPEPI